MPGGVRARTQHPVTPALRGLGALDVRAVSGVDDRAERCR